MTESPFNSRPDSSEILTIVGWLWRSPTGPRYEPERANIWARMIHRHLSLPHRFILMTDQPEADYDPLIEPVKLWDYWRDLKNKHWGSSKPHCYVRLRAFSREAAEVFGRRFVSIDLDCVVLRNLDPLFSRKEDFLIFRRSPMTLREQHNPYNGSMWMMTAGARAQVWEKFKGEESIAAARKFMGTDQAWLTFILGANEKGWSVYDGVYGWPRLRNDNSVIRKPPEKARIIFFYGGVKPWNMLRPQSAPPPRWSRRPAPPRPNPENYKWITEAYQ